MEGHCKTRLDAVTTDKPTFMRDITKQGRHLCMFFIKHKDDWCVIIDPKGMQRK